MTDTEKQSSREEFAHRLEEAARDSSTLLELGKSCFLAGEYEDAIASYSRLIALQKRNAAAFYNLGMACQAMGNMGEAKKAYLKTLEIDPNHEPAQQALNTLTAY